MERLKLDIQRFASVQSDSFEGRYLKLTVTEESTSIANNTSTVRWTLESIGGWDNYYTIYNCSVSMTYAKNSGTSTITETVRNDGTVYWDDYRFPASKGSVSGTITVKHKDDGTALPVSFTLNGKVYVSGYESHSGSISLSTIPRASNITSFIGLNDGQGRTNNVEGNFKVDFTRYVSTFTDNLVIEYQDVSDNSWNTIKTISNCESGDTFSFTNAELQTLFGIDLLSNDIKLRAYLNTYSSGTLLGTSSKVEFVAKIYDNAPVFSDFDFADINPTTLALTGDNSININNYSNIQVTISTSDKAVAQKGATMVKYRFVCGNQSTDIEYSSSASVNGTINNTENGTYQVYAIDSRGNSTLVTKLATSVKEYIPITRDTNYSATRNNSGVGGNVTISFSGTIWNNSFGLVSNAFKTAKYLLKKTDSSTWIDLGASMTNITPTITNNTYSFSGLIRSDNPDTTWDLESSYDIKIILEDKLSSVEFIMTVASAIPNISLSRNGVGIMCDYDETLGGLLQVGGEPYGAGGDTLPINAIVEYDGDTVPDGYEQVQNIITNGNAVKTGRMIDGKEEYVKRIKCENLPTGNVAKAYATGINFNTTWVIKTEITVIAGSGASVGTGNQFPIPNVDSAQCRIRCLTATSEIEFLFKEGWYEGTIAFVNIYYISRN